MSSEKPCIQVVVVSDRVSEGFAEDLSGSLMESKLIEKGLCIAPKITVRNVPREILGVLRTSSSRVLVFIGGTGPSPRDITVDVVEQAAWRCLPGFGEYFRRISLERVGVKALLSRATLCILHDGKVVFVLPGSPDAASIGADIISQLLDHLIEEVDRFEHLHK